MKLRPVHVNILSVMLDELDEFIDTELRYLNDVDFNRIVKAEKALINAFIKAHEIRR